VAKLAFVENAIFGRNDVFALPILPPKASGGGSGNPPHLRVEFTNLWLHHLGRDWSKDIGFHDTQSLIKGVNRSCFDFVNIPRPSPYDNVKDVLAHLVLTLGLFVHGRHFGFVKFLNVGLLLKVF